MSTSTDTQNLWSVSSNARKIYALSHETFGRHFASVESKIDKWRELQAVSQQYVSGLSTLSPSLPPSQSLSFSATLFFSLATDGNQAIIWVEDPGQQYLHIALPIMLR